MSRKRTFGTPRLKPWERQETPFSRFIRSERKKRNLSLRAFSAFLDDKCGGSIVGSDNSLLSRWETAAALPSCETLRALSVALDVPLQALAALVPTATSFLFVEPGDLVQIFAQKKNNEGVTIDEMVKLLQNHLRHKYWVEAEDSIHLR